jgi:hypothetical protein
MKDAGEIDQMQSPEIYRTKSCTAITSQLSIRQLMEEVGNIEVQKVTSFEKFMYTFEKIHLQL